MHNGLDHDSPDQERNHPTMVLPVSTLRRITRILSSFDRMTPADQEALLRVVELAADEGPGEEADTMWDRSG